MRVLQAIAGAVTGVAVVVGAQAAYAQTTTGNVQVNNVKRTVADHIDAFAYSISQTDCLSSDAFDFPLTLAALDGVRSFEVWIGEGSADCSQLGARNNSSGVAQCRQIGKSNGEPQQYMTMSIASSAIAEKGIGANNCVDEDGSSAPRPVTIYFMLIRDAAANVVAADYAVWSQTQVDLLGPNPPTGLSATAADGAIELQYKVSSNATDTKGFRIYCDDGSLEALESASGSGDGGSAGEITTGAGGVGGASAIVPFGGRGAGGAGGAGGTGGQGGDPTTLVTSTSVDAATGTTSDVAASSTSSGEAECRATVMVAGEPPNPKWTTCGTVDGTTGGEGVAKGLKNGRQYAVAIAAIDDLGNEGVLSEIVCASPFPVTDFYEAYVDAGGQAGGGLCSVSLPGLGARRGWGAFCALIVGAAAAVVGRRVSRGRAARSGAGTATDHGDRA